MARKVFHWVTARKWVQGLSLIGWIVLWVVAALIPGSVLLSHLPANLDPLLFLAVLISTGALTSGGLLALTILLLTLIFGRAWCGWLCPIGTILDIFHSKKSRTKKLNIPDSLRKGKYFLLIAIILAAIFGNLSLLIFDPITIWTRTLTGGIAPALNTAFSASERFLSQASWLRPTLQWLDQLARPVIFPLGDHGIRLVWLPVLLLSAIILLNLLAERFWCRYLCPLGGLLGFLSQ